MLNLIVFLTVALVLLQVVALCLQAQRLLQMRFRYPRYEVQPIQNVPADLKPVFKPTIVQLKQLGFRLCGAYRAQKIFHFEPANEQAMLLYHPQQKTYAEVEVRWPADGKDLVSVNFYQRFGDATWLLTMNGQAHGIIETFPDTIVADPYCASLSAQWTHHQERCLAIGKPSEVMKPGRFLAALQKQQQRYVDRLLAEKHLVIRREGWFLSGKAAIKTAVKLRRGVGAATRRQSARQRLLQKQPELIQAVPLSLKIQSFQRLRNLETNHRDLRLGKWLLGLSLLLFVLVAIALPDSFGTWKTIDLLNLLVVLFLHEAGHFLAMKLFGYQDTKMFFLPMFGAAVTGRKADASLSEKVWVLLAGPLPGLLLGFGLIGAMQIYPALQVAETLAWMLITLNVVNLLPIYPLDGGKVAHHLLFSRYPWTDVVFKVLTVIVFSLLGMMSPPLLLLAVATACSIPTSYRTAKLNLEIQQQIAREPIAQPLTQPQPVSDASAVNLNPSKLDLLALIFQHMTEAGYAQLPVAKQDAIAKDLMERQREIHAPVSSRWGLASLYCVSLLIGVSGTVMAALPRAQEAMAVQASSVSSYSLKHLKRANQVIHRYPRRAQAYADRAQIYQQRFALHGDQSAGAHGGSTATAADRITADHPGYADLKKALTDYNTAIRLEPENIAFYQLRSRLHILMGKSQLAIADYTVLIQRQPQKALLYFDRAQLNYDLGNYAAAIADATQTIRRKSDYSPAYELRSQANQAIGESSSAAADRQKAYQLSRDL